MSTHLARLGPLRWFVLAFVACGLGTATFGLEDADARPRAYMSCGGFGGPAPWPWKFVSRPRTCDYTTDGSLGNTVLLRRMKWSRWGGRVARGKGTTVNAHDQSRHAVTVVLKRPRTVQGKRYYRRMRLTTRFGTASIRLQTPPIDDL